MHYDQSWAGPEQRAIMAVLGHTCRQVQQAEVRIHDCLLPDGQQADLGHERLRPCCLHLPQQQHDLQGDSLLEVTRGDTADKSLGSCRSCTDDGHIVVQGTVDARHLTWRKDRLVIMRV